LLYDLVKASVIRLAYAMAWDLAETKVAAVALSPGFLRSEHVLEVKGVSEANWRDAVAADPSFEQSETPFFVGRAVAALAADPDVRRKSGLALFVSDLADEYGFTDVDGRVPRFWPAIEAWLDRELAKDQPLSGQARWIASARYAQTHRSPERRVRAERLAAGLGFADLPAGLAPS
ncbi:MAG TPA: hypothetical protein VFE03_08790, partial [Caulobacteraceae bacterium]|nr:hypothetical protein [Caulobacteraceae bacterium]